MDTWPLTLPQNLLADASVQDDESRLVSDMDAGPASVRNRFTAITQSVKGGMILTGGQLVVFKEFFRTTLKHGMSSFFWKNPETDEPCVIRFSKKPQWVCVKSALAPADRLWSADLELEIQP